MPNIIIRYENRVLSQYLLVFAVEISVSNSVDGSYRSKLSTLSQNNSTIEHEAIRAIVRHVLPVRHCQSSRSSFARCPNRS